MTSNTKRPTNEAAEEILGQYFPVLDHGFVSLVDYMGTDECIERAARVSYGYGTRKRNMTRGLIRYLRKNLHTTPSEMVELKFHCCMPIFVARQWIRHRMSSTNEFSGRYSLMPMLFYTPELNQFKKQSLTNNQGRGDNLDMLQYQSALDLWNQGRKASASLYENLTSAEVARELARIDLPLSTYTQWYWKIDLHNLLHFLKLRVDAHAQWEIQQFGKVIAGMLKRVAPLSYEAWIDYDVCGVRFSREEINILQKIIRTGNFEDSLVEANLSSRDAAEFRTKLISSSEVPDFELDLSQAKSPDFFSEKMAKAVPQIDQAENNNGK